MKYMSREKGYQNRVLMVAVLQAMGGRIESSTKPFATEILHNMVTANGGVDIKQRDLWNYIRHMAYIDTLIIGRRTHLIEVAFDKIPAKMQKDVKKLMPSLSLTGNALNPIVKKTTVAPVIGLSNEEVVRVALELLTQAVAMGNAPKETLDDKNVWRESKEQNDKIKNLILKNNSLSKQNQTYLARINALEAEKSMLESNLQAAIKASACISVQVRDGIEKVLMGAPKSAKHVDRATLNRA